MSEKSQMYANKEESVVPCTLHLLYTQQVITRMMRLGNRFRSERASQGRRGAGGGAYRVRKAKLSRVVFRVEPNVGPKPTRRAFLLHGCWVATDFGFRRRSQKKEIEVVICTSVVHGLERGVLLAHLV